LVAGSIAQTVWNTRFGLPVDHGISDVDLVYYDSSDLSLAAEEEHGKRTRELLADVPVWIDVKNEARVHLWYEGRFGYPIEPYRSVRDAIATFPTTATAVGMRRLDGSAEVYAPFGLVDLLNGVVRANKRQITRGIFEAKVAKWRSRWPNLTIIDWDIDSG
jgi:hypothetical protein